MKLLVGQLMAHQLKVKGKDEMFFKKKSKDGDISLDNFLLTPDDRKINEVVIEDKKDNTISGEDYYKLNTSEKNDSSPIEVNYDEKFKNENVNEVVYESLESESVQYRLAKYIVLEHIKDKIVNRETTLGNILAGIKYSNWKITELLGEEYSLTTEEEQFLLSKGVSYCNLENIKISSTNIQTKGKLKKSKDFIKKLQMFNKEELDIIFK